MVSLGLFIQNSKDKKAFIGDEIKLDLLVQGGWLQRDKVYAIKDIRLDGTVVFNDDICQPISGINDFRVISRIKN